MPTIEGKGKPKIFAVLFKVTELISDKLRIKN